MKKQKKIGLKFYLSKHKWAITFFILFNVLGCVASTAVTLIVANAIAEITNAAVAGTSFAYGFRLMLICAVVYLFRRICWWFGNYVYYKYSNIIVAEISLDLTKRSFLLSSSTFAENRSAAFVQRILGDPNEVLNQMSSVIDSIMESLSSLIIMIYVLTLNWIIGLLYIVVLGGVIVLEMYRQKLRRKNRLKNRKINDKTWSLVTEIVKSEKDIKALDLEEKLFDTTKKSLKELKQSEYKFNMTDCNLWSTRNLIIEALSVAVLLLGIYLMDKSIITLSVYVLLFTYKGDFWGFVWHSASIAQAITDIGVCTSRMFALYDEQYYPIEKFGNRTIKNMKGKIEFKNVKFAYTELEESKEDEYSRKKKKPVKHIKQKPVFEDLSFEIEPNTTVAFVGKSGSGKSTILSLISKIIEADGGKVLLDGKDIKTLTKQTLRDNISLINQFPYIFDMTVKENLQLVKKDATDKEIWEVLKRAHFDEDVKAMPKGIDTLVGESGIKLSGGQRQRLAIARALLKQTKIIIFDESTSSLDNFAQSYIQKSIENLKRQHTIVIVAHRLSTIKNVDRIYFLEKGKIIDSGTFEELFQNNKEFQDMFLIENV